MERIPEEVGSHSQPHLWIPPRVEWAGGEDQPPNLPPQPPTRLVPFPAIGWVHPEFPLSLLHWTLPVPVCSWSPTSPVYLWSQQDWSSGGRRLVPAGRAGLGSHLQISRPVHRQKIQADCRGQDAPTTKAGDLVWLSPRDLKRHLPSQKLSLWFVQGPPEGQPCDLHPPAPSLVL